MNKNEATNVTNTSHNIKLANSGFKAGLLCLLSLTLTINNYADINVARNYMTQGKPDAALLELASDIQTNPNDPEARFLKGVALQSLGRTDAAIEMYSGLVNDFPELPEPHNNLAVLFADKKQFDKAEKALRAAIQTNESYSTAYENLGDIYAQRAGIAYNDALNRDPANREAVELKLNIIDRILLPPSEQKPIPVQVARTNIDQVTTPAQVSTSTPADITPIRAATSSADINKTVMSWASAWSSGNVSNYLSHYAETFRPSNGASRSAWAKYRSSRLQAPSFINVKVSQLDIKNNSDGSVNASFVQNYQSDGYQDSVRKTLQLINTSGGWKIQQENSTPL